MFLVVVLLCLLQGLVLVSRFARTGTVEPSFLSLLLLLLTVFVFPLIFWHRWSVGRRHAKMFPSCIGEKEGWISPSHIYCKDKSGEVQSQLSSATYLRIKHEYLIMAFDPMHIAKSIIPLQAFADPVVVEEIVLSLRGKLKPVPSRVMDDRLTKDVPLPSEETIPAGAICFRGPILASDLFNSAYPTHIRNAILVAVATSLFFLGLGIAIWMSAIPGVRFIAAILALGTLFLWYKIFKFIKPLWSGDKIMFTNNGYIGESGIRIVNALHNVACSWSAFQSFRETNGTIMIPLLENPKNFHLLNRRQFQTDQDWQAALSLIASKLPNS